MTKEAIAAWISRNLEMAVMLLSALTLLVHGARHLRYFFINWSKKPTNEPQRIWTYPKHYKIPSRWIARGLSGVVSLLLGAALLYFVMLRWRGLGL